MGGSTGSVALQVFSIQREPSVALHVGEGDEQMQGDTRSCHPTAPRAASPALWVALHGAASLRELQLCSDQLLHSPRKRLRLSAWK